MVSVSLSTIEASNPDSLTSAAAELGDKINSLDASLDVQRHAVAQLREAWEGSAADAALRWAEQAIDRQEELRARLVGIQRALCSGGAHMASARAGLMRIVGTLRATGWTVGEDGTTFPPLFPTFAWLMAPVFTALVQRLLNVFDLVDQQTAAAIHAAQLGPVPEMPPGTLGDARRPPAPGSSAKDVNEWWNSLSRREKHALIGGHPAELGNMNGIPADVRDKVNRAVMKDDVTRVADAARNHGVPAQDVVDHPERYSLTCEHTVRFFNAIRTRNGLNHTSAGTRPVMLWAYYPLAFNGQGKAAIAIGNPDTATDTAVVVPGTGSSVAQGWMASDNATHLYDQMVLANPGEQTSVLAWMGYDAPDSPIELRVAAPALARAGGDLLAADVNGLAATHRAEVGSHVTVIGHSYGSTTVADAFAASGMHANDAVLIGSPGTDLANRAADFHLPAGGQVYVGAASSDPVSWFGQAGPIPDLVNGRLHFPLGLEAGLGRDPAGDGFGSLRFDAEAVGRDGPSFDDHSKYYALGSESLRSITDIASGKGDALDDNGLLAEGRRRLHVGLPHELDLPGLPPIDLPDWDVRVPGTPAFNDPEGDRRRGSITNDHGY
ncbi:MAG: alpha/beta hydrolase [Mycobacterium sp.]|nr:alpha/beta hydrolase [Mycobacterium sp.]